MKRTSMRILLAVLMMTFILSSFSFGTSAAENSAKPQTRGFYNLLDTITFDTVEPNDKNGNGIVDSTEGTTNEADTVDNRKFIYDNYGFYFGDNAQAVMRQYGDDGRVAITAPAYIHAEQNNGMEELFFSSTDGPKHFTWEMDIAVTKDFGGTGDQNNKLNYPTTRHRGMSLLSYRYSYQKDGATQYADSWFLKVTAPGVGKIAFNEDGTKATSVAAVAEGKENVGYFYATGQDISYDFTADSKIGWASGGYSYTDENGDPVTPADGTYLDGRVTAAISNAAIDKGCAYTLGEEVHLTLEFRRYKTYMLVDIYVGGKLCGNYRYNLGEGTGFKITDMTPAESDFVTIDDMKITVLDCGGDHDSLWNVDYQLTPVANNGVAAKNVCRLCAEETNNEAPNLIKNEAEDYNSSTAVTITTDGGKFVATPSKDGAGAYKTGQTWWSSVYDYSEEMFGTATAPADPFWMNFDLHVWKPKNGTTRGSLLTWMPTSEGYNRLLAVWQETDADGNVVNDASGNAKAFLAVDQNKSYTGNWKIILETGKDLSFHIRIDPETGNYDVYVTDAANGIYNEYWISYSFSALKAKAFTESGAYPAFRFIDGSCGSYTISNLTYTRNMPIDTHEHTSVEFGAEEELYIDGTSIKYTDYLCYCGYSKGTQEIKSLVVDKIENLKKGTKTLSYTAPTGEYWVTTDMNLKTLNKNGNLLAIGDTALLKLEGGKLVSGEYSATAEQKAYAVGVKLNGNAYTLYIDGENVATGEYAGSSAVTYGAADLDASFNYNKIAILDVLGEGIAPVVPTVGSSFTNVPCAHIVKTKTAVADYSGDRTSFVYICEKCGDRVYETPNKSIVTYSGSSHSTAWPESKSFTLIANEIKYFYFNADDAGQSAFPYWIDFDFNFESNFGSSAKAAEFVNNESGRNLMNFSNASTSFLRVHPIVKGYTVTFKNGVETVTTDYHAEYMSIEIGNTDTVIARLASGEKAHFSIYVNPQSGDVEIYLNGEHVYTYTGLLKGKSWNHVRINDGTAVKFTMSDIRFTRAHEHTTDYAVDITVNSADTWLGHSDVDCYCGKELHETAISENLSGEISAKIAGNAVITVPDKTPYWFATDIHIAKLSDTNLLTLGTEALLSLEGGKLIDANGDEISDVLANTTVQIAYNMLHFNENTIRLYVNGVEVGAYVVNGDTSLTLGADGLADINFLYTKVAELGDYFTPVAPAYSDSYAGTCIHTPTNDGYQFITVPGKTYSSGMRGVNKLIYSYICSACGERVYEMQGDVLNVNAAHKKATSVRAASGFKLSSAADFDIYGDRLTAVEGAKNIPVDVASIGLGAEPYWISFELSGTVSPDQVSAVAAPGKGEGGSFLALFAENINVYVQMMRAYGVLLSDADKAAVDAGTFKDYVKVTYKEVDYYYYNNRVGIRSYQGNRPTEKSQENFTVIFKSGDVYDVAIHVEPNIAKSEYVYTIYVDGVKVSVQTSKDKAHFDQLLGNYSIRLTDGNYGSFYFNNMSLVKAAQHGMTSHDVALEEGMTFGEQVSVFELTASLNNLSNENAYYPLVSLNRDHVKLSPLFVNASTGELAYKTNGNQYVSLEHTLTNEPMQIVIVFDEMTSTFRYHFDTAVVEDVSAYHHYFNISDGAKVENVTLLDGGYNGFGVNVTLDNAYNIGSSDTAEVWGFQYKELSGDIRIISGLNGLYYDEVGGYVQLYKKGVLVKDAKASEDKVYRGFVNNDHDVSAGDLGFEYVSILPIKWNGEVKFEAGTNYYIIYRPYVVLCGVEYLGEPVKINVTYDGVEAPVYAFDDNYSLNSVTDNAANITYTGHYYKDNANNTIAGTKTMPFVSTEELDLVVRDGYFYGGGAYYEFSVNPESANAAFIVIDSGADVTFNLYLNGSETAVKYDVVNGRNYLPVENLVAGEVNSIKIERKVGYREYPLVFKGMVLEGAIVAPAAAE